MSHLGGVVSVTDPAGTINYTLNGAGNPTSISAPAGSGNGITTSITYDTYGRRTSIADPSSGTTTYNYHITEGYLQSETNAKGQTTSYVCDIHGRTTQKISPEFSTTYTYNNLNKITAETSSNGTATTYSYDALGRLSSTTESAVDSKWLKKDYTYSGGRVSAIKYTSQNGVLTTENHYYTNGHLTSVKLNGTSTIFTLSGEDGQGRPGNIITGGLSRYYNYTVSGYPTSRVVTASGYAKQLIQYSFNEQTGNLASRSFPLVNNMTETFSYDNLNRLTSFGSHTVGYDNKGNITSKGDVGNFVYNLSGKPYAVSNVTLTNNISVGTQNVSYYSFDRPNQISDNGYTATFTYNGNYDRVKMAMLHNSSASLTRYYLGGCYELDVKPSSTTERLYLNGGYYDAPMVLIKQGNTSSVYHILRDHLGSITHVLNSSGTVVQELSYDAWGRLRNPSTFTLYTPANEPEPYLGRGYCGHEHLTGLGLINMNARLYDPLLGRFLSPDPYVQAPEHSQSFNRYSYCMNNPLIYKDENGEFFGLIVGAIIGGVINVALNAKNINNVWQGLAYFGIGAAAGALSAGIGSGVNVAMAGGSFGAGFMGTATGVSSTGFISGALTGAASGFAGGLVSNSGNAWMNGAGFGEGLWAGVKAGGIGALSGGLMGGVASGIDAVVKGTNFWTGTKTIDLSQYAASGFIPDELKAKIIRAKYVGNFENTKVFEAKWLGEIGIDAQGATVPDVGIIVGKGTYTSGSDIGKELLQHEYGHVLQYKRVGAKAYYSVITPESIASASYSNYNPLYNHDSFWTETWANYLSKHYFGTKWLGGDWGRIAQPLSMFNAMRLVTAKIIL